MNVTFERLPATLEEFAALPQMDLTQPANTCAMLLCGLELYVADKAVGEAALNLLRGPRPLLPYDQQFLRDRLRDKPYLPKAYFEGAAPDNNYQPAQPYVLEVLDDPHPQNVEEGYLRLYIRTAGADVPRPIRLRRKGEEWFLWEYSSVLSGIRIPKEADPWA